MEGYNLLYKHTHTHTHTNNRGSTRNPIFFVLSRIKKSNHKINSLPPCLLMACWLLSESL